MEFLLRIELGNEAMEGGDDIGVVLRIVADRLIGVPLSQRAMGYIHDRNGNAVGEWHATETPTQIAARMVEARR